MSKRKLSRADGMEAALKYLEGRNVKITEPITLLKVPGQYPQWLLERIFRRCKDHTMPPITIIKL